MSMSLPEELTTAASGHPASSASPHVRFGADTVFEIPRPRGSVDYQDMSLASMTSSSNQSRPASSILKGFSLQKSPGQSSPSGQKRTAPSDGKTIFILCCLGLL
jgi:hypothetical protein